MMIITIGFPLMTVIRLLNRLREEISYMNSRLNKIAIQMGAVDKNIDDELRSLIEKGERIKAIKEHMSVTGEGLKEARKYVINLKKK